MASRHPLSEREFWRIYRKVPRLTVEVIIKTDEGIFLTLRDIDPYKGLWHLPGGTVRFGERLTDAVRRVAHRELGINVIDSVQVGIIEYPSHYKNGLDSPVGIAFRVTEFSGKLRTNNEASQGEWFESLPAEMYDEQQTFLKTHQLI